MQLSYTKRHDQRHLDRISDPIQKQETQNIYYKGCDITNSEASEIIEKIDNRLHRLQRVSPLHYLFTVDE